MSWADEDTARALGSRDKLSWVAVGVLAAALGLAPWLVRLVSPSPLPGLMVTTNLDVALLPFTRYSAVSLPTVMVTGYGLAALWVRSFSSRQPPRAQTVVVASLSIAFLLAVAETAVAITGLISLQDFVGFTGRADLPLPLPLFVAVSVGALFSGLVMFRLLTGRSRRGALVGATLASIAAAEWISALVLPWISSVDTPADSLRRLSILGTATGLLPAVITGAAIAWARRRSLGWVLTALASLVLLWVLPVVPDVLLLANSQGMARTLQSLTALLPEFLISFERVFTVLVAVAVAATGGWVLPRALSGTGHRAPGTGR